MQFVNRWRIAAAGICLGFAVSAGAQDQPKFPYLGEVTGEKVNVRIKPNTTDTSRIVGDVSKGAKVGVVGEESDFFKILAPKGAKVWVTGRGIKYEGDMGEVTADQVHVLSDSRPLAEKLGTLPKGAQVKVVRELVGYYQIEAPMSVTLWIGKKYVKHIQNAANDEELAGLLGGKIDIKPDGGKSSAGEHGSKPGDEDPAVIQKLKDVEQMVDVESKKDQKEADYSAIISTLEMAGAQAKQPGTKSDVESKVKFYRSLQGVIDRLRQVAVQKGPDQKEQLPFAYSGWVDINGPWSGYPGTHKLLYGGKIVCFLKAKDDNADLARIMNTLYNNHVGVRGEVQDCQHPWDPYKIVVIGEIGQIVPLSEAK